MKNNIFLPQIINVGFQNRSDTYTGKLAYVIYTDEKGVLRKETSWQNWRDKEIEPKEFENIPTSGFVLNKKVGDYSGSWGEHRQAYCRIYDPRDFEFEITVENLLYILENTSAIKGKGLEGDFVYGWDGKDLLLIPTESPDFKELQKWTASVFNATEFKGNDLIPGATYKTKQNEDWIYVGRFNYWDYEYVGYESRKRIWKNKKKRYWFYSAYSKYPSFKQISSLKGKVIACIDEKCIDSYSDIFSKMEESPNYSPYDKTKDELIDISLEDFIDLGVTEYNSGKKSYRTFKFISNYYGENQSLLAEYGYRENEGKYIVKKYEYNSRNRYSYGYTVDYEKKVISIPTTLEDIFEKMKPKYIQTYLTNGCKYERRYMLDE